MTLPTPITVSTHVSAAPDAAWHYFTDPDSITAWNFASPDWCCPRAENDVRVGGTFSYRMEAADGSMGFDYAGTFLEVDQPHRLRLALGPDREVIVEFLPESLGTDVRQSFTPDGEYPIEMQRAGWQAIMDNYRAHVEASVAKAP